MSPRVQSTVKPVPDGYHTVTTYLTVTGVARLLDFLKQAFDARVIERMDRPDGTVHHAEVRIGDSVVMMGEPADPAQARPLTLYLYVPNVDELYRRGIEAGGKSLRPLEDMFYGDRTGAVEDPSGNYWYIATHIEDVPPEEIGRRAAAQRK